MCDYENMGLVMDINLCLFDDKSKQILNLFSLSFSCFQNIVFVWEIEEERLKLYYHKSDNY